MIITFDDKKIVKCVLQIELSDCFDYDSDCDEKTIKELATYNLKQAGFMIWDSEIVEKPLKEQAINKIKLVLNETRDITAREMAKILKVSPSTITTAIRTHDKKNPNNKLRFARRYHSLDGLTDEEKRERRNQQTKECYYRKRKSKWDLSIDGNMEKLIHNIQLLTQNKQLTYIDLCERTGANYDQVYKSVKRYNEKVNDDKKIKVKKFSYEWLDGLTDEEKRQHHLLKKKEWHQKNGRNKKKWN